MITHSIKLSSYCTLLNIRKVIDDSVDNILEAQIIERSKSPLSFPVVIVDNGLDQKEFVLIF